MIPIKITGKKLIAYIQVNVAKKQHKIIKNLIIVIITYYQRDLKF